MNNIQLKTGKKAAQEKYDFVYVHAYTCPNFSIALHSWKRWDNKKKKHYIQWAIWLHTAQLYHLVVEDLYTI